ncbi:4-oxalomesaconate tautomerase [Aestuariicella hydrocarbonica]|uniref:4-oxalomesaconate tautomerase n=1 Tax=Pseudomaricurvus hydrocarbonicus TaxID=1470433 RepID=A0A9E5JY64_9GAMM|nr:4-oxalomesaconate tautomerase [Aestuariicella hydrocarbonica]NHO66806.1 4-oxalomesaconate tautomerase [Aestuariicella hydrocarbonica]
MTQLSVPFMQFRGGSSKGLYFLASDLPADPAERNQWLLSAVGRDARQIDGLGGGDPLTSKVGIIALSSRDDADIDYLFVQVVVGENRVDTTPNCGNILAGVGPFAVETGLMAVQGPETRVRVHMLNSGKLCELVLQTPNGAMNYDGDTRIDGVPGTSAPVICNYMDVAGSACGSLLPTGNVLDVVDGIEVTCVDNGMPVVVLRAEDMGIVGDESPAELNANEVLKARLQSIRLQLGPMMNLGDVDGAAVPKMCLISEPQRGGVINTRTFIPYQCHAAIGVLGAVSAATACILPGSVAEGIAQVDLTTLGIDNPLQLSVEHPSGEFSVSLAVDNNGERPDVRKAGLLRTARLLSRGEVFISERLINQGS